MVEQRGSIASSEHGFTLMEMVVVVFVISVMIAVIVPHLLGAGQRAQTTACEENQRAIRGALSEYYLINHAYPSGNATEQMNQLVSGQFLSSVPREPDGGSYAINDTDANNVSVYCSVHGQLGSNVS